LLGLSREIWLMGPRGESPHKILTAADEAGFGRPVWSPAGGRMAYLYARREGNKTASSIESCDLDGANKTTITSGDETPFDFAWISEGRFVYARAERETNVPTSNLWDLQVDGRDGKPQGQPRRLSNWSGFQVDSLSGTADGKHLAFRRRIFTRSVFVGNLSKDGARLLDPRRLTQDEYVNSPTAWTADSRSVVFSSSRGSAGGSIRGFYRQELDGKPPRAILSSIDLDLRGGSRVSPDGAWLIFRAAPRNAPSGAPQRFFRVSVDGGAPQPLFEIPEPPSVHYCTNRDANFCAYPSRAADGRSWVITAFDPAAGKGKELLRIPIEPGGQYHWAPSPDGSQVAIFKREWSSGQIRFLRLGSGEARTVTVEGYVNLTSLDWAPDSKSLFVATWGPGGAVLLRVDLTGRAQALWQQAGPGQIWGIPSPDGRRVAIGGSSEDANIWMIGDF
jgi:hypothetical protein